MYEKSKKVATEKHSTATARPSFVDQRLSTSVLQKQQQLMSQSARLPAQQAIIQRQAWTTGALDGRFTDVTWTPATVPGDSSGTTVGSTMLANPLGPEHLQGGPPKSGAQKNLMRQLPTDPKLPNEQKYIRGHLLNDNVGGPGDDYNLFPITGDANKKHEQFIESTVKKWVNDQKQWVKYSVKVNPTQVNIPLNIVNADFNCSAELLDPNQGMKAINSVTANISSTYQGQSNVQHALPGNALAAVGPQAKNHKPLLSLSKGNKGEYKLDDNLFKALQEWSFLYSGQDVIDYKKIDTIGVALGKLFTDILEDALKYGNQPQTLDKGQKASLTKLNKKAKEIGNNLESLIDQDFERIFTEAAKAPSEESIFDYMPTFKSDYDSDIPFPTDLSLPQQSYTIQQPQLYNMGVGFVQNHLGQVNQLFDSAWFDSQGSNHDPLTDYSQYQYDPYAYNQSQYNFGGSQSEEDMDL